MKRLLPLSALLALALSVLAAGSSAGAGRALSLSALETRLRSGRQADVARLCGMTSLSGFIADSASHDIILIGDVDPARPALYLEDLAVAFRNTRLSYAQVKGRVRYYSAPGCSIDPDPSVIRELDRLAGRISATSDDDARQSVFDQWQQTARRPQTVRIMGVPFYSHFAKVMVDADYFMKRLTDGSANLGIGEFDSLMDMRMNAAVSAVDSYDASTSAVQSLNRFWFCPTDCTYSEEEGAVRIETCGVKLLTEAEYLTSSGTIKGTGRPDPLARRFADAFTAKYDEIGSAKPVYRDLEELFRLVGVARLLDDKRLASAGVRLPYLLAKHQVGTTPVSRALPGRASLKELNERREIQGQRIGFHIWLVSCGGVSMDVRPKRIATPVVRKTPSAGKITGTKTPTSKPRSQLKKAVLSARKSPDALSWDFPTDK